MFFERWIAVFKYAGNIGFLICISDSFGYLGSVGVLIYKNFFSPEVDWLQFILTAAYVAGSVITVVSLALLGYFYRKVRRSAHCPVRETSGAVLTEGLCQR